MKLKGITLTALDDHHWDLTVQYLKNFFYHPGILEATLEYRNSTWSRKAHFGDLEACSLPVKAFHGASISILIFTAGTFILLLYRMLTYFEISRGAVEY
jgi:hypothetical protein